MKQLINQLTDYVRDLNWRNEMRISALISKYELEKAQEFQKGYSIKQMQSERRENGI